MTEQSIIKSNKGLIGITFVFTLSIIFLLLVSRIKNSIEYLGKSTFIYKVHRDMEIKMQDAITSLNSYANCTYMFSDASNIKDQGTGFIEAKYVKNSAGKDLFENKNEETTPVWLKKAILCFNDIASNTQNNKECKSAKGPLELVLRGNSEIHYVTKNAAIYIEIFSDEHNVSISKNIPVFLETKSDKQTVFKCSSSKPALHSQICEQIQISKSCCRHKYTVTIPSSGNLINADGEIPHDMLELTPDSNPKLYCNNNNTSLKKRVNNSDGSERYTYSSIPSSSDPNCEYVDQECSLSVEKIMIEARCLSSGWDYKIGCKKR